MRLLVVSHSAGVWGAERSVLAMAPLLAARGFEAVLAAPEGGAFEQAWGALGMEFSPLRVPKHRGIRPVGGGLLPGVLLAHEAGVVVCSAARIARLARSQRAGLIHSNSLTSHFECAVAGRLIRRPTVLELHDIVAPGVGRRLMAITARLASSSVAISQKVAECATRPPDARQRVLQRITVVPQAVDTDRFHPGEPNVKLRNELGVVGDEALVGILGRLDPEKQVGVVVRAVASLEGDLRRTRLVVIGAPCEAPPGYEEQIRAEALELLGDRVRFLPPRSDVPEVLRCLDLLVNASVAEPFGLTLLEAQACGTPVVGTRAGGIPEFVEDGCTGMLVAPGEVFELAGAITRVLTDEALRSRLTSNALGAVDQKFRIERRVDALVKAYREASEQ